MPVTHAYERAPKAIGVSSFLLSKIHQCFMTPNTQRRRKSPITGLDDFDRNVVWRTVHYFMLMRNEIECCDQCWKRKLKVTWQAWDWFQKTWDLNGTQQKVFRGYLSNVLTFQERESYPSTNKRYKEKGRLLCTWMIRKCWPLMYSGKLG